MPSVMLLGLLIWVGSALGAAPPPGSVQLLPYSYSGNGCPKRNDTASLVAELSPDYSKITLAYQDMNAVTGEGYVRANRTRNCQVHLQLKLINEELPKWQYAIASTTHQGRATLGEGVTAAVHSSHIWSNHDTSYPLAGSVYPIPGGGANQVGPGENFFEQFHDFRDSDGWARPMSACWGAGSSLNVNMRVALALPQDESVFASLSLNGGKEGKTLVQTLGLQWAPCSVRGR
ncbi:hypothetical protein QBC39DRAFT_435418 [Podospora conica]|nr:hypothetical protein QBC39DRAFT_435418 [Schizothecium conicum]